MIPTADLLIITKGNKDAAAFVQSYVSYCHLLDDVVDKDKPVDDHRLVTESLALLDELMLNSWVLENRLFLWPCIVAGFNAWLDANRWEQGTTEQRRDADVVKGVYHELVWLVARLCGGLAHMQEMTARYREYNHDMKGEL